MFPSRLSPCTPSSARGGGGGCVTDTTGCNWCKLGPQRPGRVAQPHAGRPSRPRTDGHDSASPGDQRRGDTKVIKSGTSWILDVGIIYPGSQRLVSKGTDTIPGKAAALYDGKKTKTYTDHALARRQCAPHRQSPRPCSSPCACLVPACTRIHEVQGAVEPPAGLLASALPSRTVGGQRQHRIGAGRVMFVVGTVAPPTPTAPVEGVRTARQRLEILKFWK